MKYIYIHGRGTHEDLTIWRQAWAMRLEEAGHDAPDLGDEVWVEVDYQDLLDEDFADDGLDWPAAPEVSNESRRDYDKRNAALRGAVTPPPAVSPTGVLETGIDFAAKAVFRGRVPVPGKLAQRGVARLMRDVQLFKESEGRRLAITHRILDTLPEGDIVVIAHSLGTVALLGALPYLPTSTTIRLLVTAGSPAAAETMQDVANLAGRRGGPPFPTDRVRTWLNLVDVYDPITSGNGLGDSFHCVIDHRARNSKSAEGAASVHAIWSYLKAPILKTAIEVSIGGRPSDARTVPVDTLGAEMLPVTTTVRLADCLSISASHSKVHRRTRDFINERLIAEVEGTDSQLTRRAVAESVRQWAARQSAVVRVATLIEASQADPFAPFDPGLEESDIVDGLARLADDLRLPSQLANDVIDFRAAVDDHLRTSGRVRRVLGVTALSLTAVAAVAVGGPLAIGAFGAAGATGAAAFTSGLAALGLGGGMAGGVAALGGAAAGLGLLGGAVAHRMGDVAVDEEAFLTMLTTEVVHVRALRRLRDADAQAAATERRGWLDSVVRDGLGQVKADHVRFSSKDSRLHDIIARNREHLDKAVRWLDDTIDTDAAIAAGVR